MAADEQNPPSGEKPEGRQPITPAVRRRLQKCYEHGTKNAQTGNFDYAVEMYTQCVAGDPGNEVYLNSLLLTLQKKYNNNKKGSSFAGLRISGARSAMKKAAGKQEWGEVIKAGTEALKLNPWDVPSLTQMAAACEEMGFDNCQLIYLKNALDANPKDVDVNRTCAAALARQARYDEAIMCWVRIQKEKPGDEEAQKHIADLSVEKTIHKGGYEKNEEQKEQDKAAAAEAEARNADIKLTREQELEKAIRRNPTDVAAYTELAEMHARKERFAEAEKVLAKGLEASGGDIKIREQHEDMQVRRMKSQVAIAERKAEADRTEDAIKLYKRAKAELNQRELEVFRSRSERYPTNASLKYELGLRLKKAGNFKEAIQYLQEGRNDPKRKGTVMLELGECFQHIKQFKLAMSSYNEAIDHIPEREVDQRKLALYRAGVLAMGLEDLTTADKHLTTLANLDFGYKDVAERLEKIAKVRDGAA